MANSNKSSETCLTALFSLSGAPLSDYYDITALHSSLLQTFQGCRD